ncbi:hypothetical protein PSEHALCIP103_02097 [Pseudoalteromonas haloplanktis]|uniref:Uncharacterized protein n=1 Tax=Pseudoalteromonas haloplanktis TaxID=228 RepID=A0A9W4W071_PSEHA|nr:hypothetical protein [Pseudoalteromonas haloplanktis]CAH9059619.1 hypothetical protein PSEHALCIP103_02097 [Pseudoalteromonas haloplanktis]|tara:strand:- start:2957 stop:3184 length:228 start_codon:yes stop_codon:yes gene_type:complete
MSNNELTKQFHEFQLTVEEILHGMDKRITELSNKIDKLSQSDLNKGIKIDALKIEINEIKTETKHGLALAFRHMK